MYIERIEKIYLSKREDEALDVVYRLIEELINESANEEVKHITELLHHYLNELIQYTEEALCGLG